MATKGTTEVLTGDNLRTFIWERHYNREICSGALDGSNKEHTTIHKIEDPIGRATGLNGWTGSPQAQYTDASGSYFRKDLFLETLKSGVISPLNTATYVISVVAGNATGSFVATTAIPAAVAGSLLASYSSSLAERTDEITNVTIGGGGRANTYVVVQGGKRVKVTSVQESRTVSIEAISVERGWVDYLNGNLVTQSIDNVASGSDLLEGSQGAQPRITSKTIVVRQIDLKTDNQVIEAFFNVDQVGNDTGRPSEGQATETATFDTTPQDYTRISIKNEQG